MVLHENSCVIGIKCVAKVDILPYVNAIDMPILDVGVVVSDLGSQPPQLPRDTCGRRFADICDVRLIGDAQQEYALFVISISRLLRIAKPRSHIVGQVVRINRYTVTADSWARLEWLEPERLSSRSFDSTPKVYVKVMAEPSHLVD